MNIYDLAEKAGVSIATVSRVLNNSSKVSKKTREKITKIMKEENYQPSAYARGLSGTPAKTIGVLTIDIRDQYYASVIHALEQEFSRHHYNVVLCNTGGELDEQTNYISLLMQKQVDAMILVGSVFNYPQLKSIITQVTKKIPLIIVNENLKGDNIYSIICDESHGISMAVNHLYSLGHRSMAYVKVSSTFSAERKLNGFVKSSEVYNDLETEGRVIEVKQGLQEAYSVVEQILSWEERPTAILCGEDLTALGVIQELQHSGFKVPGDFSVTGFNNSIYSESSYPRLTTIDSQSEIMGLSAARLTLDVLEKRKAPSTTSITAELVIRESCLLLP